MEIAQAQAEVRHVYRNGSVGQVVSGLIWLGSAAAGTWLSEMSAVKLLVFGGFFIFPLTLLALRITAGGRPIALSRENQLRHLAMEVAFIVPLCLVLIVAATRNSGFAWFFPGFMVVVGAHYLPFAFLYGMPSFAALGGVLVAGGWLLGIYAPRPFTLGGWATGALLLAFGVWAYRDGHR